MRAIKFPKASLSNGIIVHHPFDFPGIGLAQLQYVALHGLPSQKCESARDRALAWMH